MALMDLARHRSASLRLHAYAGSQAATLRIMTRHNGAIARGAFHFGPHMIFRPNQKVIIIIIFPDNYEFEIVICEMRILL